MGQAWGHSLSGIERLRPHLISAQVGGHRLQPVFYIVCQASALCHSIRLRVIGSDGQSGLFKINSLKDESTRKPDLESIEQISPQVVSIFFVENKGISVPSSVKTHPCIIKPFIKRATRRGTVNAGILLNLSLLKFIIRNFKSIMNVSKNIRQRTK